MDGADLISSEINVSYWIMPRDSIIFGKNQFDAYNAVDSLARP